MNRIRGVDVSTFQGVISDAIAEALVKEGCAFAYCRGVVGNEVRVDDRLVKNIEVFRSHGIAVGAYLFPYPLKHLDPVVQAEQQFRLIEGIGSNVGELAPMIDAEWPPRESWKVNAADGTKTLVYDWRDRWKTTGKDIREWLVAYGARLDALSGCNCPWYTYRYWDDCIEGWLAPEIRRRPLVLADYGYKGVVPTDAQLAKVKVPRGWEKITILQHDGDGGLRLPTPAGTNTGNDVDWNVMLDADDLFKLLGQPRAPEPPTDEELPLQAIATLAHQQSSNLIVEDMIAEYRRTRIDDAT